MFSKDSEFQNKSASHTAWVTSPVIDLRPNQMGKHLPVQFNFRAKYTRRRTRLQFGLLPIRYYLYTIMAGQRWNCEYHLPNWNFRNRHFTKRRFCPISNQVYRNGPINWDEPDLDSILIRSEHAAFVSPLPNLLHPRAETVHIQTSHDILAQD